MTISAVLFDFDGVIGDTARDNYRAWCHALEPLGVTVPEVDLFMLEGAKPIEIAAELLSSAGLDIAEAAAVATRKDSWYRSHAQPYLFPDAASVVSAAKGLGLKVGLVTGGVRDRIAHSLGSFIGHFDAVITGDEVRRGKPNPEPYLTAAMRLDLDPRRCVVVENAPRGVASAKAAGMRCIAVMSTLPDEVLNGADYVVPTLGGVASILRALDGEERAL